jgi:hypothetical protein
MGALFEESWLESELDRKLPYFLMRIYAYTDYGIWQKLFPLRQNWPFGGEKLSSSVPQSTS